MAANHDRQSFSFSFSTVRGRGVQAEINDPAVAEMFWYSKLQGSRKRFSSGYGNTMTLAQIQVALSDPDLTPSEYKSALSSFNFYAGDSPVLSPVELADLVCSATTRLMGKAAFELYHEDVINFAWIYAAKSFDSVFNQRAAARSQSWNFPEDDAETILVCKALREVISAHLFLLAPDSDHASDWVFSQSDVPDEVRECVLARLGTEHTIAMPSHRLCSNERPWQASEAASRRVGRETPGLIGFVGKNSYGTHSWIWAELFDALQESLDVNQEILDTTLVFLDGWEGSIEQLVHVVALTTGHEVKRRVTATEPDQPLPDPQLSHSGDQLALL
jgi:hypothetical protein